MRVNVEPSLHAIRIYVQLLCRSHFSYRSPGGEKDRENKLAIQSTFSLDVTAIGPRITVRLRNTVDVYLSYFRWLNCEVCHDYWLPDVGTGVPLGKTTGIENFIRLTEELALSDFP